MIHAREECKRDPIRQPLRVIGLADAEERFERVVAWDDEASDVDEKLASNVEENEEEVEGAQAENHVNFGDGGLPFEVLQTGIFVQLNWTLVLCYVISRSVCVSQKKVIFR